MIPAGTSISKLTYEAPLPRTGVVGSFSSGVESDRGNGRDTIMHEAIATSSVPWVILMLVWYQLGNSFLDKFANAPHLFDIGSKHNLRFLVT